MADWSTRIIEAEDTWYRYRNLSERIDLIGSWVFFFFAGFAFNLNLVQGNKQAERSFKLLLQIGKNYICRDLCWNFWTIYRRLLHRVGEWSYMEALNGQRKPPPSSLYNRISPVCSFSYPFLPKHIVFLLPVHVKRRFEGDSGAYHYDMAVVFVPGTSSRDAGLDWWPFFPWQK